MARFSRRIRRFLADESGPTAVEYAVMLALILVVCVAAVALVGGSVRTRFTSVNAAFGS